MECKISIIIPAFNAEKYIIRCLESLTNQTFHEMEIIVVNDGSTDRTKYVSEDYAQSFKNIRIFSKTNEGQGIARNYGIQQAKGMYIGFVDADDYVEPDMYAKLYECLLQTNADWAYSYMDGETYLNSNFLAEYDHGVIINTQEGKQYMKKLLIGGTPTDVDDSFLGMSVCRSLFRTEIIKQNNLSFISERIVNSEDLLFNLDFLEKCNTICTVNKSFYHYCSDNPISFSVRPNPDRLRMFKNLYSALLDRSDDDEETLRATRRFLANIRIIMVEKSRWCNFHNFSQIRTEIKTILDDPQIISLLNSYPIKKLPVMQRIYFYFMKFKSPLLLIITAKLRYKLL